MTNKEKYDAAFIESLDVTGEQLVGLEYQAIPTWDSVGHMTLVAAVEDAFDIEIETDDIVEFNSYEKGKEILKKYDVSVE